MSKRVRLERLMAKRAGLTRSQARGAILTGRVSVGALDETVRAPSTQVDPSSTLYLDGDAYPLPPDLVLFHKPPGVLTAVSDGHGRTCLADVAGDLLALGLHPVGRLDMDSEGLLPFSRNGGWTQYLLHPKHQVEKVYRVEVEGNPQAGLAAALADGVRTAEGVHTGRLISVDGQWVTLAVTEGKHRMVRRMMANLGLPVQRLIRLRFGPLELGDLSPGEWRAADESELQWMLTRVGS